MATRKFHHHHDQRPKFLYLGGSDHKINPVDNDGFEMNESDMWNNGVEDRSIEPQNNISRRSKFPLKPHQQKKVPVMAAKSLPVNVPDWSKILRDEYKHHGSRDNDYDHDVMFDDDDDNDDGNDDEKLPPHEFLARTRNASFSVHEGIGRTLKGRDLSRVRNAIWKQTGFEQD
ncbi:protein S40-4-like [Rutidosis leptorrhynchoides]|uniref:protein S40-4-like n=1 Tax=Rutidosis leptorrhynchoides TaxID=125765 RepID=UPI003A99ED18